MTHALNIAVIVTSLLARTPEWVRQDLGSKDALARQRAEETLALMIESALCEERAADDPTSSSQDEAPEPKGQI